MQCKSADWHDAKQQKLPKVRCCGFKTTFSKEKRCYGSLLLVMQAPLLREFSFVPLGFVRWGLGP